MDRKDELSKIMAAMPYSWRYYWCGGGPCACSGAANCSGGLMRAGFSKEEWRMWVEENPIVIDRKILELSIKELSKALDSLIGECVDTDGRPKAPTKKAVLKAKACLPAYCEHAFKKAY